MKQAFPRAHHLLRPAADFAITSIRLCAFGGCFASCRTWECRRTKLSFLAMQWAPARHVPSPVSTFLMIGENMNTGEACAFRRPFWLIHALHPPTKGSPLCSVFEWRWQL